MFGLGLIPILEGPLHLVVAIVFDILILALFVRMLLSFFMMMMPVSPSNPFVRFIDSLITPLLDPIRKRIPRGTLGMFDVSYSIAFIFVWWSLEVVALLILQALPHGW